MVSQQGHADLMIHALPTLCEGQFGPDGPMKRN